MIWHPITATPPGPASAMIRHTDNHGAHLMPGPVSWDAENARWVSEGTGEPVRLDHPDATYHWCREEDFLIGPVSRQGGRVHSAIVKAVSVGVIAKPHNWRAFSCRLLGAQWIDADDVLRLARAEGFWWKEGIGAISIADPIPAGADVLIHFERSAV